MSDGRTRDLSMYLQGRCELYLMQPAPDGWGPEDERFDVEESDEMGVLLFTSREDDSVFEVEVNVTVRNGSGGE